MTDIALHPRPLHSFLKWAGGKTRTARLLASLAPREGYEIYFEPFCGSAAVFFALQPERAILADDNTDLIACLQQVAADPRAVMTHLDRWPNERAFFSEVRDWDPCELDPVVRAARVIYLNKTAFRGLWRVNRQGRFNTPYGEYDRPYYNRATLLAASAALKHAEIRHASFREILLKAEPGDWVYADPPYVPDRAWGDFTRYTAGRFGPSDQEGLADLLGQLDRDGVRWLLTNSNTKMIRTLYAGYKIQVIATRRDITLQAMDRESVDLVITNYDPPKREGLMSFK
jgi:DNA adenine methylase